MNAHGNEFVSRNDVKLLSEQDRKQALKWYAQNGYDLQTIAQHFGLTVDQLKRELNRDNKMKDALEGELYQYNRRKAFQIGYFVVIGITLVFYLLSPYIVISTLVVTDITLYFGVLSFLVSQVIFNRD